jgi:periplasmic protein TonB
MTGRGSTALLALVMVLPGRCARSDDATVRLPTERPGSAPPPESPPVALNAESPVGFPPALLTQGVEGIVVLHLFVDANGTAVAESTRVAESSGYPALDSAALAAVPQLHYAPAMHAGTPVATAFLQPIQFRNPQGRK